MPLSGIRAIHAMPLMMLDQTNACLFDNLVGDKKRDGSEQTSNDGANKRITLHNYFRPVSPISFRPRIITRLDEKAEHKPFPRERVVALQELGGHSFTPTKDSEDAFKTPAAALNTPGESPPQSPQH